MKTDSTLATFQVGRTYTTRSVGDHECIFSLTVESRTKCFITTVATKHQPSKRLGVHEWDGAEAVAPEGRYSMCPIIRADRADDRVEDDGGPTAEDLGHAPGEEADDKVSEVAKDILAVFMHPDDQRYQEVLEATKVRISSLLPHAI